MFQLILNTKLPNSFFFKFFHVFLLIHDISELPSELILILQQLLNTPSSSSDFSLVFPSVISNIYDSLCSWIQSNDFYLFNFPSDNLIEIEKDDLIGLLKSEYSDRVLIYFLDRSDECDFTDFYEIILSNCFNSQFALYFLLDHIPPLSTLIQYLGLIPGKEIIFHLLSQSIQTSANSDIDFDNLFALMVSFLDDENVFIRREAYQCINQIRNLVEKDLIFKLPQQHQMILSTISDFL